MIVIIHIIVDHGMPPFIWFCSSQMLHKFELWIVYHNDKYTPIYSFKQAESRLGE